MRKHGYSALVQTILKAEAGLREYRPTHRPYAGEVPHPPPHAEEVLTALLATYPPGTPIGLQQVLDAIAIEWNQARAVRAWAEATGCWPWPRPSPFRPGGPSDPGPSRRGAGSDRVRGDSRHRQKGGDRS